jgi:hypothetical protein
LGNFPPQKIVLLAGFGILTFIFTLFFPFLKDFPGKQRAVLFGTIFIVFLGFLGFVIYIFNSSPIVSIKGTVRDCVSGAPLKAEIYYQGSTRVETNTQTGYFTLPCRNALPFKGDLIIKSEHYKSSPFIVEIRRFDTCLTFRLCPDKKEPNPASVQIRGIGAEVLKTKIEELRTICSNHKMETMHIDIGYSGQIQKVNENLFFYSGGALSVKVNGGCCSPVKGLEIEKTEPFGNPRADVERQIVKRSENLISRHLPRIIESIEHCL